LHLGYDQARRHSGDGVPAVDLDETIAGLARLLARRSVRRLIVAGDLLENSRGRDRAGEFSGWLAAMSIELSGIVPGNHDRAVELADLGFAVYPDGIELGAWRIVHGHGTLAGDKLVLGHFHPCFRWPGHPPAPCYLVGPRRLILPAFSPDAAGESVRNAGRWRSYRCLVIAGDRVLDFGPLCRLPRRAR
jgi:metallophosphoesterase superfamily enzyme